MVGDNVSFAQRAIFDRNSQFPDLTDGGFSGINKNPNSNQRWLVATVGAQEILQSTFVKNVPGRH